MLLTVSSAAVSPAVNRSAREPIVYNLAAAATAAAAEAAGPSQPAPEAPAPAPAALPVSARAAPAALASLGPWPAQSTVAASAGRC